RTLSYARFYDKIGTRLRGQDYACPNTQATPRGRSQRNPPNDHCSIAPDERLSGPFSPSACPSSRLVMVGSSIGCSVASSLVSQTQECETRDRCKGENGSDLDQIGPSARCCKNCWEDSRCTSCPKVVDLSPQHQSVSGTTRKNAGRFSTAPTASLLQLSAEAEELPADFTLASQPNQRRAAYPHPHGILPQSPLLPPPPPSPDEGCIRANLMSIRTCLCPGARFLWML
ncbi:hypothetical protein CORC01_09894, partial [Colletotrichum orchidophilum]